MKELYTRPIDALTHRFPQFTVAVMSLAWGVAMVLPNNTFETSRGYDLLTGFADEWVIGAVVGLLGLLNLHALITERWWLHRKSAIGLMLFWTLTAMAFFTSAPASASWVLLAGLAFLHGWSAAVGPNADYDYDEDLRR